jgi:hypothetical protein
MRAINKSARKVMYVLTENCKNIGDHEKFHTEPYMDVSVEHIGDCNLGPMFSVAHYYEQNGDLMRDPEMRFIESEDGEYYPHYYRQDGLGIERECIRWDREGNVLGILKHEQSNQAVFAGTWMRNIKNQQEKIKNRLTNKAKQEGKGQGKSSYLFG